MTKGGKKIRLIRKTSKPFLWVGFALMLLSTLILYFYVRNLLRNAVEEELFSTEARIEIALRQNNLPYALPPIVEIEKVNVLGTEKLKDTVIFDPSQDEMEAFRELTTFKEINGQNYRITVRNLIVESEDILIAVVLSYLIILLLVFVFLFYFNKKGNQQLWHPFFKNLEAMKRFTLGGTKPIELIESDILEFTELNAEITTLTNKVRSDYQNLKQYTEDVSHELQTPLAIIQAKIENIINENHLNDMQFGHLTSIQNDIQRLTQLNKRLTLLTKIENRQFVNEEVLMINDIVQTRILNFSELFPNKIAYLEQNPASIKIDRYLADILCDNLISNALKHSKGEEPVRVAVNGLSLSISNVGEGELKEPAKLFSRFYREDNTLKSTGLGLAIVEKICELYGFQIHYFFSEGRHVFKVDFH
jgi:signal transduction histidine kinase